MTREDIIQMAKEAGMFYRQSEDEFANGNTDGVDLKTMQAFAKLVAEHERSECADMVFRYISQTVNMEARGCLASVAYDIRARGEQA